MGDVFVILEELVRTASHRLRTQDFVRALSPQRGNAV